MGDFFAITLLVMMATISPGPDFAIVVKNSLSFSRMSGVFTALGVSAGILFHASYCILGLSIIVSQSTLIFSLIKYIGATYLIYIGIKSVISRNHVIQDVSSVSTRLLGKMKVFQQGFLCNALNPKAILFFISLFTIVIKPDTHLFVQVAYAFEIALISFIWFSGLSVFLTHETMLSRMRMSQAIIAKVMGSFLVIFGVRMLALA